MLAIVAMMIRTTEAEIARLEGELALERRVLDRLRQTAKGEAPKANADANILSGATEQKPKGSSRPAGSVMAGSLVSHIIAALRDSGEPMRAAEIAKILAAQGVTTEAKAGLTVSISSALAHSKGKIFHRIAPGTYVLQDEWAK